MSALVSHDQTATEARTGRAFVFPRACLSVVIPTLDAAESLVMALGSLDFGHRAGLIKEVVVADGGSQDATVSIAAKAAARVVESPPGRGAQLATGAAAARGAWLLFLHADTTLFVDWPSAVGEFIAEPANAERAGAFRLVLDDPDPRARRVERLANWRARALGLPYGDQGLLIARAFYERLGGYRPLPLMEDVELVRRIGRANLDELDSLAFTSAARYRTGGWWLRPLRNLSILALYFLGVSPARLKRLYG